MLRSLHHSSKRSRLIHLLYETEDFLTKHVKWHPHLGETVERAIFLVPQIDRRELPSTGYIQGLRLISLLHRGPLTAPCW